MRMAPLLLAQIIWLPFGVIATAPADSFSKMCQRCWYTGMPLFLSKSKTRMLQSRPQVTMKRPAAVNAMLYVGR